MISINGRPLIEIITVVGISSSREKCGSRKRLIMKISSVGHLFSTKNLSFEARNVYCLSQHILRNIGAARFLVETII